MPDEEAIVGMRFRLALTRKVGQHELVRQMLAETAPTQVDILDE